MSGSVARLRMVAGPNGSGKSTILDLLEATIGTDQIGIRINPDDLERELRVYGELDLEVLGVETTTAELVAFFEESPVLRESGYQGETAAIRFEDGVVSFDAVEVNSYVASALAAFIRQKLLESKGSFTFETVMSHPSKVEFLEEAHQSGFRTYLYYVAIDDPGVSVTRVANRVELGGHDVPEDKIVDRYRRSLDLLYEAIRHTDRAYIFDNSGDAAVLVAEVTDAETVELKVSELPRWFERAVWSKLA